MDISLEQQDLCASITLELMSKAASSTSHSIVGQAVCGQVVCGDTSGTAAPLNLAVKDREEQIKCR